MNRYCRIAGATVVMSLLSSTAYAQPPHQGGLPPGLQKKLERGQTLPPGWRDRTEIYDANYDESSHDRDGYTESDTEQNGPEYVEDTVYRMIKDARILMGTLSQ